MHRFFLSPNHISGDVATFPPDLSRQIARVLRMSPGDRVIALDDTGLEYTVALSVVDAKRAEGRIADRREGRGESAVRLTLCLSVTRPERFEWALQKCTELGVSRFVPVITRRTTRRYADVSANRLERWRRIIREAAEQSGRSRLPTLDDPRTLESALKSAPRPALMAWEEETRGSLESVLGGWRSEASDSGAATIFIGPEGGYDPDEVESARAYGVKTIGLGVRILRSETAAAALTAIIMHELGELRP